LYRGAKNLEEAIKAYKFALKLEPESPQILRDLAFLQIQTRDYQGYIQSRKAMLQARPALRQNWTALAVAYHLAGELSTAEKMLKTYEDTLKQPPPRADYENSDAVLYRNSIIEEMGETERALEQLDTIFKSSLDRTAVMEARARHLMKLGRSKEAEQAYRALVERNNEYRQYYEGLEEALGLDRSKQEDVPKLIQLYESFAKGSERLDAARRIPLEFLQGADFEKAVDSYLKRMLKKGVPSTFANLKSLYSDKEKRSIILKLVESYLSDPPHDDKQEFKTNGDKPNRLHESSIYFLAQHYSFHITRDLAKAMKYIDQALDLTPGSVDYHHIKGRIWKHYGNPSKAAELLEKARQMDERDRYINTKCAKYQLRNNENDLAIKTMSKFTRNEAVGGALGDLHDMQCMWYITEEGEAFVRRGKLGAALKRFKSIYDIFDVWEEDQFDFHQFSLRKGQVRAYIDMMRWEDRLREHPFFTRAAIAATRIYVSLFDNPDLAHSSGMNGSVNLEGLDANNRKKALKKAKKEQEKQDKIDAGKREADKKNQKKPGDAETKKDDSDPNGVKLLETASPLDDAMPYVLFLLERSPKNIASQTAAYEVFYRKSMHTHYGQTSFTDSISEKYLLALKCLQAAKTINPEHPVLHEQLVRLRLARKYLAQYSFRQS
jgi:peptide alpha-N-acetyltransferase